MHTEKHRVSFAPLLGLFFTAPLVAEFLLGDLPIKMLAALIVLAPLYGGGALLIRELVRRSGRGWPSILLLGVAYGIIEEAYTTQSLFDPNYLKLNLGLLTPAYIPSLGMGAWWTLWVLMVHGIWSISTPMALIEACVPDRARTPWCGRFGLAIIAIVFLGSIAATTITNYRMHHYMSTKTQFAGAAIAVLLIITLAFRMPVRRPHSDNGKAPSALLLGCLALAFASAALLVPKEWGWGAVAALLALVFGMVLVIISWKQNGELTILHQLALGAGAALAYGAHAFMMHPLVGTLDSSFRVGNVIFLSGAIGLIAFAAKRSGTRRSTETLKDPQLQSALK